MPEVTCKVRAAQPGDEVQLWALICGLAHYEHFEHELAGSPGSLAADLFGPHPRAEVLVVEEDKVLRGYAMYFPTYDSYSGTSGLWLSDLFVLPERRGAGLGRALLGGLAQLAIARGATRLELDVLTWNLAALEFYRSVGAVPSPGWARQRLDGDALTALAAVRND